MFGSDDAYSGPVFGCIWCGSSWTTDLSNYGSAPSYFVYCWMFLNWFGWADTLDPCLFIKVETIKTLVCFFVYSFINYLKYPNYYGVLGYRSIDYSMGALVLISEFWLVCNGKMGVWLIYVLKAITQWLVNYSWEMKGIGKLINSISTKYWIQIIWMIHLTNIQNKWA